MKKFKFLCANHHRWLSENPAAAKSTWLQAYSRSIDLVEDCNYPEAILQAGAAFETAEMILDQEVQATSMGITRFADSAVLLAQLLYSAKESRFASAVVASSISRFEQLLVRGVERKAVLSGCEQLLKVGESVTGVDRGPVRYACSAPVSHRVH